MFVFLSIDEQDVNGYTILNLAIVENKTEYARFLVLKEKEGGPNARK